MMHNIPGESLISRVLFNSLNYKTVKMEITTSKKVEFALKDQGRNKTWLAMQLGVSRPVLYQRLKDNLWNSWEVDIMKNIGLI